MDNLIRDVEGLMIPAYLGHEVVNGLMVRFLPLHQQFKSCFDINDVFLHHWNSRGGIQW